MPSWSNSQIQDVWDKGRTILGKDPDFYRKDVYGNEIYRSAYGKSSRMGWQIDHIKPRSKGGSNFLSNLRPLQTQENQRKTTKSPS